MRLGDDFIVVVQKYMPTWSNPIMSNGHNVYGFVVEYLNYCMMVNTPYWEGDVAIVMSHSLTGFDR